MPWVEIFSVFVVSHLIGDFVFQTEWQAATKAGGLGRDPQARSALFRHVLSYTVAFVPALIWIGSELDVGDALLAAALIAVPHLLQDDGRLLRRWMVEVKRTNPEAYPGVAVMVDQSIHLLALLLLALLIGSS